MSFLAEAAPVQAGATGSTFEEKTMLRIILVAMLMAALVLLPGSVQAQGIPNGPTGFLPDGYIHYGAPYSGPHMIHGFMHYGSPYVAIPQPGGTLPLTTNYTPQYSVGAGTLFQHGYRTPFVGPTSGYRWTPPSNGYYNGVRTNGGYTATTTASGPMEATTPAPPGPPTDRQAGISVAQARRLGYGTG
jgi:hypothetical protein